jgi:two-component system chemotaxis response regulator CheB
VSGALRVLVADDSPFVCQLLTSYMRSAQGIEVVATAQDGSQAVEQVQRLRPDVVTLDLDMPATSGLVALEHIMHECPTPVVVISGVSRSSAAVALQAMELGAVDIVLKYIPGSPLDPAVLRQEIISKVKAASQIKVVRSLRAGKPGWRGPTARGREAPGWVPGEEAPAEMGGPAGLPSASAEEVVVLGASTGGPVALRELLGQLPSDFPAAVIIVQHLPVGFTRVLATQLDRQGPLRVREAEAGDRLLPALALVAPANSHLLLGPDARVELNRGPEIRGHRPSIDVTMQSVSQLFGPRARGVVLTGMGDDGASGLASIRNRGGETYAQDDDSCVINGMPRRAREQGVVDHVATPAEIARLLSVAVRGPEHGR